MRDGQYPDGQSDNHERLPEADELNHKRGEDRPEDRTQGESSRVDRRNARLEPLLVLGGQFLPTHPTVFFQLRVKHRRDCVVVDESATNSCEAASDTENGGVATKISKMSLRNFGTSSD